jgi:hypothetical protein
MGCVVQARRPRPFIGFVQMPKAALPVVRAEEGNTFGRSTRGAFRFPAIAHDFPFAARQGAA